LRRRLEQDRHPLVVGLGRQGRHEPRFLLVGQAAHPARRLPKQLDLADRVPLCLAVPDGHVVDMFEEGELAVDSGRLECGPGPRN